MFPVGFYKPKTKKKKEILVMREFNEIVSSILFSSSSSLQNSMHTIGVLIFFFCVF
jgi:hypothetical protein